MNISEAVQGRINIIESYGLLTMDDMIFTLTDSKYREWACRGLYESAEKPDEVANGITALYFDLYFAMEQVVYLNTDNYYDETFG